MLLAVACTRTDPDDTSGDSGDSGDDDALRPGDAFVVGPGAPGSQNEDPAVLSASDGTLWVAWYSNRGAPRTDGTEGKHLWVVRSSDGVAWSEPVQVTEGDDFAFTPSLAEGPDGTLHLAFWRVHPLPNGCSIGVDCTGTDNRIAVTSSVDGVAWDAAVEVTTGPGDWLPSLVMDGSRRVVVFSAVARDATGQVDLGQGVTRLFRVHDDGDGWTAPTPLTGMDQGSAHHSYPQVLRPSGGGYAMSWTRYDATASGDVLAVVSETSTDTLTATSTDGIAWTAPGTVSDHGVDVFPHLYEDHDGTVRATWITAATEPPSTVEVAFGGAWADRAARPELDGYASRVVATRTPGVLLGAWVSGDAPTQRVYARLFRRSSP